LFTITELYEHLQFFGLTPASKN